MKTIEIKFYELCDEIDYWKEQAFYYKDLYERTQGEYSKTFNQSIKGTKELTKMVIIKSLEQPLEIK